MFRILKWLFLAIFVLMVLVFSIILSGLKLLQKGDIKERTLNAYNAVINKMGDEVLTSNLKLRGKRTFGVDHYVGTYTATYQNYTGTECIFGGSILERENGDTIHVSMSIENSNGTIEVIMKQKEQDNVIANKDGTYTYDFDVQYGSNYLVVQMKDYSGNVTIQSK